MNFLTLHILQSSLFIATEYYNACNIENLKSHKIRLKIKINNALFKTSFLTAVQDCSSQQKMCAHKRKFAFFRGEMKEKN